MTDPSYDANALQPTQTNRGVHATNYGSADNPARIYTPNHNDAKPTTPRHVTPTAYDADDGSSLADQRVAQQWRDAVAAGLLTNIPDSINSNAPGGG